MEIVKEEVLIDASVERIGDELRRLELFKEFMGNVEEIKILHREKDRQVSSWRVNIDGIELAWVEEDNFVLDRGYMSFKILEGDFDRFEGFWHLKSHWEQEETAKIQKPQKTGVELVVKYDLGLPSFDAIIGEVLRGKVVENSRALLGALKKRCE